MLITKTAYMNYILCPRKFWLDGFRPQLKTPLDEGTQRRLRLGQEVDEKAREMFPDGRFIPGPVGSEASTELTRRALDEGVTTLFQAAFQVGDLLVRTDILTLGEDGWHLLEVKSSSNFSRREKEYVADVAFQLYVLDKAGLPISRAAVMLLNKESRYPQLDNLFRQEDVTGPARELFPQIAADVDEMRRLAARTAVPDTPVGRFCSKPDRCRFYEHCWQGIDGVTIYDVPYLKRPLEEQLEKAGVLYIENIPADFQLGDKRARRFVKPLVRREVVVDKTAIRDQLAQLAYPLYFLDFETIDYPVPRFDACRPYQHVPFQYSCHIMAEDGSVTHCEYLHGRDDDPRRPLVVHLLDHLGSNGTPVAYYATFEIKRLQELADFFPRWAGSLLALAERAWDQLAIFRQHYRHYRFSGSNSLKNVLPVVAPHLSYDELPISNGTAAQVAWERMVASRDHAERQRLDRALRQYCRLDTWAMVAIHEALRAL